MPAAEQGSFLGENLSALSMRDPTLPTPSNRASPIHPSHFYGQRTDPGSCRASSGGQRPHVRLMTRCGSRAALWKAPGDPAPAR